MNIPHTRELKSLAASKAETAPQGKKIVLIYGGLVSGLALASLLIRYLLGLQIAQLGGLSNLGLRTLLSTVQTAIPLVEAMIVMCFDLGYLSAMLRIARGQYASPNALRLGFDRFWVLLRSTLLQGLIYAGLAMASVYAASLIFVMSPWGADFTAQIAPMMAQTSLLSPEVAMDESLALSLMPSMMPMFILIPILSLVLVLPVSLQLRMVNYVIIDKPGRGALFAIRESRKMMRGRCLKLLKLDLSYWWYFLLLMALMALGSADVWILPLLGIELPIHPDVAYFLFYILYLSLQFGVYFLLRNRIEVSYALFYDSVKPEEPQTTGVVLGNIFQM